MNTETAGEAVAESKPTEASDPPKWVMMDQYLGLLLKLFKGAWWTAGCIAALVSIAAMVVLGVAAVSAGWDAASQSRAAGDPWFSGIEWATFATPVTATIAGAVAIMTARWGINSARAQRLADRLKWEAEHNATSERHESERRDATERTLRDRFHELVSVLSSDDLRAREAAAYALAGLADDWNAHYRGVDPSRARSEQQVCVNVLIAQLRDDISDLEPRYLADRRIEFKRAIQRIITSRLSNAQQRTGEDGAWSDFDFHFGGCTLIDFSLEGQRWNGKLMSFDGATFVGERTTFAGFQSIGGVMSFDGATFDTKEITFENSEYHQTTVRFAGTEFRRNVLSAEGPALTFEGIALEGELLFEGVRFRYMGVKFDRAVISGTRFSCADALLIGTSFSFNKSEISSTMFDFDRAYAEHALLSFDGATVSGNSTSISGGHFIDTTMVFDNAQLQSARFKVNDSHFWTSRLSFESATVGGADVSMSGSFFHSTALVFDAANVTSERVDMSWVRADFSVAKLAALGDVEVNTEDAKIGEGCADLTDCETCLQHVRDLIE